MGREIVPLVRKTLAETPDNEVRLRCEMVLKGLREKLGPDKSGVDGDAAPAGGVNYDASKVTLDVKDAPLSEVLESLAEQSGNTAPKADKFADRRVTLSVKDVPYWQAFDKACESAGVVYQSALWRGATAMLVDAKVKAPGVSAYAGPVVLWVDRVQRTSSEMRTLSTRTDTATAVMAPTQRSINVQARMSIEDRLVPSGCAARFTVALTPDGTNVLPKAPFNMPAPAKGARRISYTNWSPTMSVPDSPEGIQGPLTLEGKVQVEYFHGTRRVQVDDVFAGGRKTAGDDDVRLVDVAVDLRAGNARISFTLKTDEAHAGLVGYEMPKGYGFTLVDPAGKPQGAFGGWSSTGEAVSLDIRNVPDVPGKWSLLLVYPERVETKEYPFTIKDVPLP
jgi:hypothetical protein